MGRVRSTCVFRSVSIGANRTNEIGWCCQGNPALADSQIYVTLANRPDLNNRYTVFGRIIAGDEVPARLERGDQIRRMYVRE